MTTDMHDGDDCPILWEGCAPTWPPLPSPVPDATPYREELTAAGPQLVIPGCERRPIENGKPAQLGLFG